MRLLLVVLMLGTLAMAIASVAVAARVEIYFDEALSQTSFCGYDQMAGDTLRIYMVAEEVASLSGALFAIRGSFCNLCMWDIRGTHYPSWVTSWSGLPFDTVGAEIHGDPQVGPRVLLATLDAVILHPGNDEATTACSSPSQNRPLGYWDSSGDFFGADSACGWVYRLCPPVTVAPISWGLLRALCR